MLEAFWYVTICRKLWPLLIILKPQFPRLSAAERRVGSTFLFNYDNSEEVISTSQSSPFSFPHHRSRALCIFTNLPSQPPPLKQINTFAILCIKFERTKCMQMNYLAVREDPASPLIPVDQAAQSGLDSLKNLFSFHFKYFLYQW